MSGEESNVKASKQIAEEAKDICYFLNSARLELQEIMLKDSVRTLAYRDAIYNNKQLFQGKIVMDVGCGTGILSLFAAEAGASKVIAVECTDMADTAKAIVKDNQRENVITVVKGMVEHIKLPQGIRQVDIIVSDWMGQSLYMESMLESVIYARDKWLAPGGLILPNVANLYVAGVTDHHHADHLKFWNNVEGFNMSCIRRTVTHEAVVDCVTIQQLLTEDCRVHSLHLHHALYQPVGFRSNFQLRVLRSGTIHAIVVYFDVAFLLSETQASSGFSTSPRAPWTHWEQTLLHLDEPLHVQKNELVTGVICMQSSDDAALGVSFELAINFKGTLSQIESFKIFRNHQKPQLGR